MSLKVIEFARKNYSFILKCMAALASAALFTLAIIAACSTKSTLIGGALVATAVANPIIGIASGLLLIAGGICLLPFLFSSSCFNSSYRRTPYSFANTSSYNPGFYGGTVQVPNYGYSQQPIPTYLDNHHSHSHHAHADHHGHSQNRHHGHF